MQQLILNAKHFSVSFTFATKIEYSSNQKLELSDKTTLLDSHCIRICKCTGVSLPAKVPISL